MTIPVIVAKQFSDHQVGDEVQLEDYRAKLAVRLGFAVSNEQETEATFPDWWPDWSGQPAVIVASGPSAADADIDRARGRCRFLAINDSWRLAPWADVLYACDFRWWARFEGVPQFGGIRLCQDSKISLKPQWGVHRVEAVKRSDELIPRPCGVIGWGGNSGFGALNLAVQFGANPIGLVGYDMRLDKGIHWHGAHGRGLSNPHPKNVERWRRALDGCASVLAILGVRVFNLSSVSALRSYPTMTMQQFLSTE